MRLLGGNHRVQRRHEAQHLAAAGPHHARASGERFRRRQLRYLLCPFGVGVPLLLEPGDDPVSPRGTRGVGGRKRCQERQADRRVQFAKEIKGDRIVVG